MIEPLKLPEPNVVAPLNVNLKLFKSISPSGKAVSDAVAGIATGVMVKSLPNTILPALLFRLN